MSNFLLIFIALGFGALMGKLKLLPRDAYKGVNAWLIYLVLPAVSLRFVPEIEWSTAMLLPLLAPAAIWGGAWVFVRLCDRKLHLSAASRTALLITCGLGNTGFFGFPMITAFYGGEHIHDGVVFDQTTFLIFATLGVIAILKAAQGSPDATGGSPGFLFVLGRVLRFPPFVGCLLALILPHFMDIEIVNPLLDKLVATMSPMSLFSIGLQLRVGGIREEWRLLTAGLCYKLLLAPVLVTLLALAIHPVGVLPILPKISVFQAAMPSHVTASLLASQYNHNPRYCSLAVGLGILSGFATCTLWYFILERLF
ncbi:MAG: AEC family transporter [Acidobacteriota bacterium]|jgi:predicted permease|nr:AEC family transporter [Acidobacteriota bacterium]